jgi:hypothetical protein
VRPVSVTMTGGANFGRLTSSANVMHGHADRARQELEELPRHDARAG